MDAVPWTARPRPTKTKVKSHRKTNKEAGSGGENGLDNMQKDSSPRGQWTALVSGLIGYDFKRQQRRMVFRGLEGSDVTKKYVPYLNLVWQS